MTSIKKVLISFDEYTRLKDIEKQFEQLSKEYEELKAKYVKKPENEQIGSGSSELLTRQNLKEIIDLVKQELTEKPRPVVSTWQNYGLTEPTITAIGHPENVELPRSNVVIEKSDLNDRFDEKKLLRKIPREKKSKASELLQAIEARPSEITFDSDGVLYIDENGIEGSNIFKLFPLLFQKTVRKKFTGFEDFVKKLSDMGLEHLIENSNKIQASKSLDTALKSTFKPDEQWWYLD